MSVRVHTEKSTTSPACPIAPITPKLLALTNPNGDPRFGYAVKEIQSSFVDRIGIADAKYYISGTFESHNNLNADSLLKANQLVFDCDLKDVVKSGKDANGVAYLPIFVQQAKDFFAQNNITEVYKTGSESQTVNGRTIRVPKSKAVAVSELDDVKNSGFDDVLKAFLTSLPADTLKKMVGSFLPAHMEFVRKAFNGKLPNAIIFTGTGYHAHYFLGENDGWTPNGIALLAEADRTDLRTNIAEIGTFVDALNKSFGATFGHPYDNILKQIGTAAYRAVGSYNNKCSANTKLVERLDVFAADGSPLWNENTAIEQSDFTADALPKVEAKFSEKVKAAKGGKRGRPAKAKEHKPKLVNGGEFIDTAIGLLSVAEIFSRWEELRTAGSIKVEADGSEKLTPIRLDWVSKGSMNAWARRPAGSETIYFTCNVAKYATQDPDAWHDDENGNKIGSWVFHSGVKSLLEVNDDDVVLFSRKNIFTILDNDPTYADMIRYNRRIDRIEIAAPLYKAPYNITDYAVQSLPNAMWLSIKDDHTSFIRLRLMETYYAGRILHKEMFLEYFNAYCASKSMDEVHDWVRSLKWDGVNRIDTWLPDMLNMHHSHPRYALYAAYGRVSMLSILRGAFTQSGNPIGIEQMLVLTGSQGDGKSTLTRVLGATHYLGRKYFSESELDFDKKADMFTQLQGKLVAEIPELAAIDKKGMNEVKAFITKGSETQRKAYDRQPTDFDRTTFLIGTTNNRAFLVDNTGSRRFMCVSFYEDLNKVNGANWDLDKLVAAIPQMYAEAYERVVLGQNIPAHRSFHTMQYCGATVESWNLTADEKKMQNSANEAFEVVSAEEEALQDLLNKYLANDSKLLKANQIHNDLAVHYQFKSRMNNKLFSDLMCKYGWANTRQKDGTRAWQYNEPTAKPSASATSSSTSSGSTYSGTYSTASSAKKSGGNLWDSDDLSDEEDADCADFAKSFGR